VRSIIGVELAIRDGIQTVMTPAVRRALRSTPFAVLLAALASACGAFDTSDSGAGSRGGDDGADAGAPDAGSEPDVDSGPDPDTDGGACSATEVTQPGGGPGCPFGPGEQGCVCGFKASVHPSEWDAYQTDCDFFGGFCRADCCPSGQRIDPSDPTRCVPENCEPLEVAHFGPWPDYLDETSSMRLHWVVYGADSCTARVSLDGGPATVEESGGIGLVAIDELAPDVDQAAIDASLSCEGEAGTATASYQIAAAGERVRATGTGAGFPQPVEICWSVLPFFMTEVPPFAGGQCHAGLCPAGEDFDPFSTFPCFAPSFTADLGATSGCVTSDVDAAAGDRAYVACENGDIQTEVHALVIEP
jgi:hypothetical protein